MKKISQLLAALLFCGAIMFTGTAAYSQDDNTRTAQSDNNDDDDDQDWGWIGLIGLAGLLGLRKRDRDDRHDRDTVNRGGTRV